MNVSVLNLNSLYPEPSAGPGANRRHNHDIMLAVQACRTCHGLW